MSDQPKPLSAILAEMHAELDCIDDTKVIPVVYIKNRLPRIEAAAELERVEIRRDAEIEWTRIGYEERKAEEKSAPGNAAAMRESIETMRRYAMLPQEQLSLSLLQRTIHEKCDAALAAPARNCDRFQNWHDAMREEYFTRSTPENVNGYPYGDEKRWREFCDWLFAPAEGGDHA